MITRFWGNLSFRSKILVLLFLFTIFIIFTCGMYQLLVKRISKTSTQEATDTMLEGYKNELKSVVDMEAVTLASATEGITNEDQIHRVFEQLLKKARFFPDKSGYIFVNKTNSTCFVHPAQPDLEGKNLMKFKDPTGKPVIKDLNDMAVSGGGYVRYIWKKPGKGLVPKLSYARMVPGDDRFWMGAGVYLDNIQVKKESIQGEIHLLVHSFVEKLYTVLGIAVFALLLPMTFLLIKGIVTPVRELTMVADEFSRGSLELDIPYIDRSDEVGKLAKALDRLGVSISVAMSRLKSR